MPFLNLTGKELDMPIYRIMKVEHLTAMFVHSENVLVRPHSWEDPFENLFLSSSGITEDGTPFRLSFRDHFFAQCWSRHKETDLMWRGYSPDNDRVKVKSTVRLVHDSLYATVSTDLREISCFLGKVQYLRRANMEAQFKRAFSPDGSNGGQVATLLTKRYGFRSESEVRLVVDSHGYTPADGLYRYPIDPHLVVQEVVLDPRMPPAAVRATKTAIRAAGYSGRLLQSGLYKRPKPFVIRLA